MHEHSYRILFRPLTIRGGGIVEATGSTREVADADIVIEHDGEVTKDRFGDAAEILSRLADIAT